MHVDEINVLNEISLFFNNYILHHYILLIYLKNRSTSYMRWEIEAFYKKSFFSKTASAGEFL